MFSRGLAFEEDGDVVPGSVDESGLYQIKLDLYDAAGNQIDIAAKGIDYYVPDSVSLSGSIPTVKASSVTQPGGGSLVQGNSLVLTLHVDNNHCWAGVGAPWTPSGAADPCCGVLRFAPGASVSMRAIHRSSMNCRGNRARRYCSRKTCNGTSMMLTISPWFSTSLRAGWSDR